MNSLFRAQSLKVTEEAEVSAGPVSSDLTLPGLQAPGEIETRNYSRWASVPRYALWQISWLWLDQEPQPNVTPGTEAYPILQMLSIGSINHLFGSSQRAVSPDRRRYLPSAGRPILREKAWFQVLPKTERNFPRLDEDSASGLRSSRLSHDPPKALRSDGRRGCRSRLDKRSWHVIKQRC